jgi:signal transduction histidine kinase
MRLPGPLFFYSTYEPALATELVSVGARTNKPHMSVVIACLLVVTTLAVGSSLSAQVIAAWLGAAFAVALVGFWVRARDMEYTSRVMTRKQLRNVEWIGTAYAAMVGALWGNSSQLMIPGEDAHNLIVMIVYFGVGAGVSTISLFSLGRQLVAALLMTFFFVLPLPTVFPEAWGWLALMIILFSAVLTKSAIERRQIIVTNLQLRYEKHQLLERQQLETAKAIKANQDKSAFLAAASHDLRQPLHALMLTGHALSLHPAAQGEARVLVQRILEAGNALSEQFNQLMDLSRLESGTYHINIGAIAVPALVQRVVSSHQQVAEGKGVCLWHRVDRRLSDSVLSTDGGLLTRILSNLVHNAIKFSNPGKSILVCARLNAGRAYFVVYDQGIGIPQEQQENIFKPYVQLNNPTREISHGIGLGLSVVQQATLLVGGELSVRSQPGRGSRFALSLPAKISRSLRLPIAVSTAPPAERLRGKSLLLVEDDFMSAMALIAWARNLGLRVKHCADPRKVPATLNPDLILCDIRLPGEQDGINWLTDWLVQWPGARGLLLSAEISADAHQRAEQEGLLLLTKPVQPNILLQTLLDISQ